MEDPRLDKYVVRADSVSGCKNLIAFAEAISVLCSGDPNIPFSLVTMDVNHMKALNQGQGRTEGNKILRWIALVAQAELEADIYRIGGDEFVAILTGRCPAENVASAQRVFEQLNHRGEDFGLQAPVASMSVIHYPGANQFAPADLFARIYGAISTVKTLYDRAFKAFQYDDVEQEIDAHALRGVTNRLIERVIYLGARLDESLEMAFTDPVTSLPNQRMAQMRLEQLLSPGDAATAPFALLLLDGDDLRRYNEISYAAGDEMIYQLGQVIRKTIRPEDFLARWKVGDEFLVLLAGADPDRAVMTGKRICKVVEAASHHWLLPVTVSIGVSAYPDHGDTAEKLIHAAELANSVSKKLGKNRVSSFVV